MILNFEKGIKYDDVNVLLNFKRDAFHMMADDFHGNRTDIINNTKADYRYIINKYIKPLPHIKNKLEQIKNEYFPQKR